MSRKPLTIITFLAHSGFWVPAVAASFAACAAVMAPLSRSVATEPQKQFKPNNGCRNTGPAFEPWLAAFKKEAAAQGVSQRAISQALDGMTLEQGIINIDRGQTFFSQPFLSFYDKLASRGRVESAQRQIQKNRAAFDQAEKEYGVPPAVISAFWALESDFGTGMGNKPVLRSLAALAWDCRRGDMFREELMAALKIIDRGDLVPPDMIGSWAGELGQTQFLPTHYFNHAVDYDGDGRRDLMRSAPDIIGSSANFLKNLGWQTGEPWLEEVRVPENMAWEQAALEIKHPRSYWANAGVKRVNGQPLPADDVPSTLLLLMGKNGPAFLAYPNFDIFMKWNQSLNYTVTAAHLANRINGGGMFFRGQPIQPLETNQLKDLQGLLVKGGFYVGEPDGRLGLATRAAVRAAQLKLGMAADGYPSFDLMDRLRRGR
jgi:lytic murein transglycosylase